MARGAGQARPAKPQRPDHQHHQSADDADAGGAPACPIIPTTMLLRSPTSKRTAAVSSSLSIGGLSRRQANAAVQTLIDHGLLSKERGGRRPRYRIVPGHEVPPVLSQAGTSTTIGRTPLAIARRRQTIRGQVPHTENPPANRYRRPLNSRAFREHQNLSVKQLFLV